MSTSLQVFIFHVLLIFTIFNSILFLYRSLKVYFSFPPWVVFLFFYEALATLNLQIYSFAFWELLYYYVTNPFLSNYYIWYQAVFEVGDTFGWVCESYLILSTPTDQPGRLRVSGRKGYPFNSTQRAQIVDITLN